MKTAKTLLSTLFLSAGLAAALPALAFQGDCGPGGPGAGGPGMMGMEGRGGDMRERMQERMTAHRQKVHDALKLTPDQETAWKKYSETMQPPAASERPSPEAWAKLSTPERAEKMLELSKKNQERMTAHVAALKTFYATLTPEQQKTFEEQHAMGNKPRRPQGGPGQGPNGAPGNPGGPGAPGGK
ncbi:MAG: hypothetical protein RIR00_2402 [Pseudomonadota bacterium]